MCVYITYDYTYYVCIYMYYRHNPFDWNAGHACWLPLLQRFGAFPPAPFGWEHRERSSWILSRCSAFLRNEYEDRNGPSYLDMQAIARIWMYLAIASLIVTCHCVVSIELLWFSRTQSRRKAFLCLQTFLCLGLMPSPWETSWSVWTATCRPPLL